MWWQYCRIFSSSANGTHRVFNQYLFEVKMPQAAKLRSKLKRFVWEISLTHAKIWNFIHPIVARETCFLSSDLPLCFQVFIF